MMNGSERVQKIISGRGYCSRRKAEELISAGKVFVDGKKARIGDSADPSSNITIDGVKIKEERKIYLKVYKPKYVLTSLKDPSKKRTIISYLDIRERIYPAGRLDYDAEGLLIMTNDGEAANRIMHPSFELAKTYQADLRDRISDRSLKRLSGTIRLKDGPVRIGSAKLIDRNKNRVEITIHEGRNKIVKRIFKELGFYVKRLKRTRIGNVSLGNLKPGRYRHLTSKEKAELLQMKVMVFGSFDIVHKGHINFFKQAKEHGTRLVAVVARDETIKKVKGKAPLYDEKERASHVRDLGIADKVMLGSLGNKYKVISQEKPDIIALGHDQSSFDSGLKDFIMKKGLKTKVIRLKPYKRHKYRSSLFRERMRAH